MTEIMKFGYLRSDDDGHQYVIPEEELIGWHEITNKIFLSRDPEEVYLLWEDIDTKFGEYRVEGELYDMKILMGENEIF